MQKVAVELGEWLQIEAGGDSETPLNNGRMKEVFAVAAQSGQQIELSAHWRKEVESLLVRLEQWLRETFVPGREGDGKTTISKITRGSNGPGQVSGKRTNEGQLTKTKVESPSVIFRLDIQRPDNDTITFASGFNLSQDFEREDQFHIWSGHYTWANGALLDHHVHYSSAILGTSEADKMLDDAKDYVLKTHPTAESAFIKIAHYEVSRTTTNP